MYCFVAISCNFIDNILQVYGIEKNFEDDMGQVNKKMEAYLKSLSPTMSDERIATFVANANDALLDRGAERRSKVKAILEDVEKEVAKRKDSLSGRLQFNVIKLVRMVKRAF